jgi:hypothetical protein
MNIPLWSVAVLAALMIIIWLIPTRGQPTYHVSTSGSRPVSSEADDEPDGEDDD